VAATNAGTAGTTVAAGTTLTGQNGGAAAEAGAADATLTALTAGTGATRMAGGPE
jgi:hypothetical protein